MKPAWNLRVHQDAVATQRDTSELVPLHLENMSGVGLLRESRLSVNEWLASPYVERAASRIAYGYRLLPEDAADLLQELRLALWKAGPDARLNATWIFRTAMHKAVDILRRRKTDPIDGQPRTAPEEQVELLHLLHAKAGGLPQQLRNFYVLRFEHGLSQRETAARLGLRRCQIRLLDRRCLSWICGQVELGRHRTAPLIGTPHLPPSAADLAARCRC